MLLKGTSATYCIVMAFLSAVLLANAQAQFSENLDADKLEPNTVLTVGPDVSAPQVIYSPDPEYSEEALNYAVVQTVTTGRLLWWR